MNTTEVGDKLEAAVAALLQAEIDGNRFYFKRESCQLFRKKGYYSRDRQAEIVFDVSIEVFLPGALTYSILVLIESKNYSSAVPVNDVEEFHSKVQQVTGTNVKAILASNASFQSGTRSFAESKGIALLRYFDSTNFKWDLLRSPSGNARSAPRECADAVLRGLARQEFVSTVFDLYMQTPSRLTNSLPELMNDLAAATSLGPKRLASIANLEAKPASYVPYMEKTTLEGLATRVVSEIGYSMGPVSLEAICEAERDRCNLHVELGARMSEVGCALGSISFDPLEIRVYAQLEPNFGRERFTLAHELAHHLLGHGSYLAFETCDEGDFALCRSGAPTGPDISRMEFQANFLAASLLMPYATFVDDFRVLLQRLGVSDRGYGALYVDNQPCNLQHYEFVVGQLSDRYRVSRMAAAIRLESLGLLRDVRSSIGHRPARIDWVSAMSDEWIEDPADQIAELH